MSSFLASVFLSKVAPIDIGDVCGMNLWDMENGRWDERLLALAGGGKDQVAEIKQKLGEVATDGGAAFSTINNYFVTRYGFDPECKVIPFTGDNPSTILSLPLRLSPARRAVMLLELFGLPWQRGICPLRTVTRLTHRSPGLGSRSRLSPSLSLP